jgi:hypothetical protein
MQHRLKEDERALATNEISYNTSAVAEHAMKYSHTSTQAYIPDATWNPLKPKEVP